ncbi:unnamed protein product, partial [marine sediment metagenome]
MDKILSEFVCKKLYYKHICEDSKICRIGKNTRIVELPKWVNNTKLVCKVDEKIKGRMKKGLVLIDKTIEDCLEWVKNIEHEWFILEPYYQIKQENYLMIRFGEDSDEIFYSTSGGIDFNDIESCKQEKIDPIEKKINYNNLGIDDTNLIKTIEALYGFYNKYHLFFMEINPLI